MKEIESEYLESLYTRLNFVYSSLCNTKKDLKLSQIAEMLGYNKNILEFIGWFSHLDHLLVENGWKPLV